MSQMKNLKEPSNMKHSLENIDNFVIIYSHLQEWGLQRHLNSPVRAELIKSLFCKGTTRWEFVKQVQLFEETLVSVDLSSTIALESHEEALEKSEEEELKSFDIKILQSNDPAIETRRLSFWISTVAKFANQLRSLSLYDTSNQNQFNQPRNSFFEQNHQNPKVRCFACNNFHVNKRGKPSQY